MDMISVMDMQVPSASDSGSCNDASFTSMPMQLPDGGLDDAGCAQMCLGLPQVQSCQVDVDAGVVHCTGIICLGGRRFEGFVTSERTRLERIAELEAASVHAFYMLADELGAFGAPTALVRAALRSARDEVRHARMMGRLAGTAPRVAAPPRRVRSLVEVAVENAREGCVRETFGAAVARLESVTAGSPRLRNVMASIYPDEERHAELAFAVDAWARPKLTREERRLVNDAKQSAREELRAEVAGSLALLALVDAMPG